jgi:hypothetical protein
MLVATALYDHGTQYLRSNFYEEWNLVALLPHQDQHQLVQGSTAARPIMCSEDIVVHHAIGSLTSIPFI